jgi:hypothetical protein
VEYKWCNTLVTGGKQADPRGHTTFRVEQRLGTLTKLDCDRATLTLEDGTELVVTAPEMIYAEVGMTVTVSVDTDGTVVVRWL